MTKRNPSTGRWDRTPEAERFSRYVEPEPNSGCWLWSGSCRPSSYGWFYFDGRNQGAHRFAWKMANGTPAGRKHVLHRCDNPQCVNPDHLFLGTNKDNIRDKVQKGRVARSPGEQHSRAKLTLDAVRQIRRLRSSGVLQRECAAMFGVSRETVSAIDRGASWRGLE